MQEWKADIKVAPVGNLKVGSTSWWSEVVKAWWWHLGNGVWWGSHSPGPPTITSSGGSHVFQPAVTVVLNSSILNTHGS